MALPFLVRTILRNKKSLTGKNTTDAALNLFNKGYKAVFKKGIPPTDRNYAGISTAFRNAVDSSETKGIIKKQTVSEAAKVTATLKRKKHELFPELKKAESEKISKTVTEKIKKKDWHSPFYLRDEKGNIIYDVGSKKYYDASKRHIAKELNVPFNQFRNDPNLLQILNLFRGDRAIGRNTPVADLMKTYGKGMDYGPVLGQRQQLMGDIASEKYGIMTMLNKAGIKSPLTLAGMGHTLPVKQMAKLKKIVAPDMSDVDFVRMISSPANINPEMNIMNMSKTGIEKFLNKPKTSWARRDLSDLSQIMEDAQMATRYYTPEGQLSRVGMKGQEIDPERLARYVKKIIEENPFTYKEKLRFMPGADYIRSLLKGDVKWKFQAGGLASLLGKKLLKKIAGKLSEKELKMLMGSLWKGVDPRSSPRYKAWDKQRWGPGYKWPYKKSRVKGPEIKKSHMADLSPGERVELQTKHADKLWEYQMKKKLGRDMYDDLEYPFLNPDNEAFIVTEPRTGLGRYQLQHYVDPENIGPVDKYKVYDWWDEIMNKMRKKPKFKYVKDAKGNIVLRKIK